MFYVLKLKTHKKSTLKSVMRVKTLKIERKKKSDVLYSFIFFKARKKKYDTHMKNKEEAIAKDEC